MKKAGMRSDIFFHGSGSGSAGKIFRIRIRPEIEMKKKIYLYFRWVGIKFDILNHHFKIEFIDSGLYFVQGENDFINPLLQVASGSNEKVPDLDPVGQKSTDPDSHFCF